MKRSLVLILMLVDFALGAADTKLALASESNVSTKDNKITATLSIEGEDVLFIEFGTGIKYSAFEHPLIGDEFPYGPGTYPGKGHWDDPKGWWFKDDAGQKHHTYGNPALMPAYNAATTMEIRITTIAREVFSK